VKPSGFAVRTTEYKGSVLVNICDEELIGKTVTEGKLMMNISKEFYLGEVVDAAEALDLIKRCAIINLAGHRSVSLAVDNSIGSRQAIREIENVPFLMIYKFFG
jgi:hypothetical protein